MKYIFKKEVTDPPAGSDMRSLVEYGVEWESLDGEIKSLYHIGWHGWTPQEVQMIIDRTNELSGDNFYRYQVEGSDLLIHIAYRVCLFL